jgi:hypothetical protein
MCVFEYRVLIQTLEILHNIAYSNTIEILHLLKQHNYLQRQFYMRYTYILDANFVFGPNFEKMTNF